MIRPGSTAELAQVVAACAAERVTMVPQGGGTGPGGGRFHRRAVSKLISLARMNRSARSIRKVFTMTVEAGCILADIQRAAESVGLLLFPLSASGPKEAVRSVATCRRTREARGCFASETVAIWCWAGSGSPPTDECSICCADCAKDNTGYHLSGLFCGAEGTLGIVGGGAEAVSSSRKWPRRSSQCRAWMRVIKLLSLARAAGETLTGCEFIPRIALDGC